MTSLIIILSFFFSYSNSHCGSNHDSDLIIKTFYKGDYSLPQIIDTAKCSNFYYLIDVDIINRSPSEVSFMLYTCSALECFILDSDCFEICYNNCNSNYLTTIKLKTNEKYSIPLILQASITKPICNVKIGFIQIDPIKIDYLDELKGRRQSLKDVIWSEPILLHPGGGLIYQIEHNCE